jgi:hypothetical protein
LVESLKKRLLAFLKSAKTVIRDDIDEMDGFYEGIEIELGYASHAAHILLE